MNTATTPKNTASSPNPVTEHEDLFRQFNAGLHKVKFELEKNLAELDPLDHARIENFLSVFNQRLIVFQHEFLDLLSQDRGGVRDSTIHVRLNAPRSRHRLFAVLGGGGLGGLAGWLAKTWAAIPTTTGHLLWKKTVLVSLAKWLAVKLGIPLGVSTAGVGLAAGIFAALLIARVAAKSERKRIRRAVLASLDRDVLPRLQVWAKECIAQ